MQQLVAARIDTLRIESLATNSLKSAVEVVPDEAGSGKPLPVVYLLHGWSGSYRDWPAHIDLRTLADRYRLFIVCPDGGYDGWYVNSPVQRHSNYQDHIIKEVLPTVEARYPVQKKRALCGLSMGGHGALLLALKHPDLFLAAGSMSGVVDLLPFRNKYGIAGKLGPLETHAPEWRQNSVLYVAANLDTISTKIIIDCGTDDFTIDPNRRLHQQLLQKNIPHFYIERPGGHSWNYWTNALEYHLLYFSCSFKQVN